MRLLFDQNAPWPLRHHVPEHDCTSSYQMGWDRLVNGDLIAAAEAAKFDVLVTLDKRIRYQQNLTGRRIGIVVLPEQRLEVILTGLDRIKAAILDARGGAYVEVDLPRPPLTRRPWPPTGPE